MHPLLISQLLTLLAVANGMPIIVEKFLGKLLAFPIDGGERLLMASLSSARLKRFAASPSRSRPTPPSHR